MGRAVFPPCCLTWGQTLVEVMKKMGSPSKGPVHALPHSVPPTLQQTTPTPASNRDAWTLTDKSGSEAGSLQKDRTKGESKRALTKWLSARVSMSIFNTMYLWRANQRLPTSEEAGFYDVALKSNKLANSKNLLGGRINIEGWYNILSNMPAFSHTEHRRYSRNQESVTYAEKTKLKSR